MARPPVRATQDVDLIAEIASKAEYYEIAADLRRLGFQEDLGEVICRWRFGNLKVDVMPSREGILNFTNKWYADAIEASIIAELPDKTPIRLITAPYFIATKLEAFYDRGKGDYMSHDIEDIVNVIDGRKEIIQDVTKIKESAVAIYLRAEVRGFDFGPAIFAVASESFQANRRRTTAGLVTARSAQRNRWAMINIHNLSQSCNRGPEN